MTKKASLILLASLVAALAAFIGVPTSAQAEDAPGGVRIDAVFFAQTHVHQPDSPYFKLVGNRDALLKVHVVSPTRAEAPPVFALLTVDGAQTNLVLRGPATLPESIPIEPGVVQHRFDNSFTVMLPKAWIRPGLKVTVTAGDERLAISNLKVGAPTVIDMTMFDIHFFDYEKNDYAPTLLEELEAKWPVSALKVQRIPNVVFRELVVPPRPMAGLPAVRSRFPLEYKLKCEKNFDGKQAAALFWMNALRSAGAQYRTTLFFVSIYNRMAAGEAWDFGGVARVGRDGVVHHELGHAFLLPHWGDDPNYPYQGPMHGISHRGGPHVGPVWGFDARIGLPGSEPGMPYFNSPIVHEKAVGGTPGHWKNDPMQGGMEDQDPGHLLRMFSDYSVHKMQEYLERHVAVWDEGVQSYVTWDDNAGTYSKILENNGVSLPVVRDAEVYSVIVGVSAVTPEANIVYPPIGPYASGLINLFDPTVPADMARAKAVYKQEGGCDVSLRVIQGGTVKTFLLPIAWRDDLEPLQPWSYFPGGINLPVRDGTITRAELLLTPDAEVNGMPESPKVLDTWEYDEAKAYVDRTPFRAYFKYPEDGHRFSADERKFVLIEAKDDAHGIEDVTLSVDGKTIDVTDVVPPIVGNHWEWGISENAPLPTLSPGVHTLEALVRSKSGQTKTLTMRVFVDG